MDIQEILLNGLQNKVIAIGGTKHGQYLDYAGPAINVPYFEEGELDGVAATTVSAGVVADMVSMKEETYIFDKIGKGRVTWGVYLGPTSAPEAVTIMDNLIKAYEDAQN